MVKHWLDTAVPHRRQVVQRKEGDALWPVKLLWLSMADLAASSLSDRAVDEALQEWEATLTRRRVAAMTMARDEREEGEVG